MFFSWYWFHWFPSYNFSIQWDSRSKKTKKQLVVNEPFREQVVNCIIVCIVHPVYCKNQTNNGLGNISKWKFGTLFRRLASLIHIVGRDTYLNHVHCCHQYIAYIWNQNCSIINFLSIGTTELKVAVEFLPSHKLILFVHGVTTSSAYHYTM